MNGFVPGVAAGQAAERSGAECFGRERQIELLDRVGEPGPHLAGLHMAHSMVNSASAYTDPERFAREQQRLFRDGPVFFAPSCELSEPDSYRSATFAGIPVVVVRQADGSAKAMVNACRHRGGRWWLRIPPRSQRTGGATARPCRGLAIEPIDVRTTKATTSIYAPGPPHSDNARNYFVKNLDLLLQVTGTEDFPTVEQIQANLDSGALPEVVYGRNEPPLIHFHTQLNQIVNGTEGV